MLTAISLVLGTAMVVLGLFWKMEETLTPSARTATAKWLRSVPPQAADPPWPARFVDVFDTWFGRRFGSGRFFCVSAVVTLISGWLISIAYMMFHPHIFGRGGMQDLYTCVRMLILIPVLNILIDYTSVVESRIAMGWMARCTSAIGRVAILVVDLLLTACIHVFYTAIAIVTICCLRHAGLSWVQNDNLSWMCEPKLAVSETVSVYLDVLAFNPNTHPSFSVSFYTTFLTSIWVWLYFGSGVIVRGFFVCRKLLGKPIEVASKFQIVDESPMKLLGLISAALVMVLGGLITAITAAS